jgi:DNA-binding IscR family transcriptional regulator
VTGARRPDGEAARATVLDALLDLPLGATLRDLAKRTGRNEGSVAHQVHKLKKTGQVIEVKRGYNKRRVLVPVRLRLSSVELEWLKLGVVTARAILVVARAGGKRVSSSEVARALGWRPCVARCHLQRARAIGLLDARHGAGYSLPLGSDEAREYAGLSIRTFEAVEYVVKQDRRVPSEEIARLFDITAKSARWHLTRAVKAGLLQVRIGQQGGYTATPGAKSVNWTKSTLHPPAEAAAEAQAQPSTAPHDENSPVALPGRVTWRSSAPSATRA